MTYRSSHEPDGYDCPFCRIARREDGSDLWTVQSDVFYRTDYITAFINARWWVNNPGHALVIPNQHVENIYALVPEIAVHVHEAVRQVAIAFKQVYGCDGTSTRQHNEPAGYQEVWHYHIHVFPRYNGDELYERTREHWRPTVEDRLPYARKLKVYFDGLNS